MAKRFIGNVKGVSITAFSWEYYLSSSKTVLDGGSWSESPPTLGNNKYLWMRSKVTLSDSTIQYTTPVCEGVWEEIYGIYAEGEKIDGALEDITNLKSRMEAEEDKIQDIEHGGTGATTEAAAREALGIKSCGTYDILPVAKGGTGKTTATEALKNLGGMSLTKLWENASWTSAFSDQKITLDLSGYDYVMIIFNYSTSSNTRMIPPIFSPVENGGGVINNAEGGRRYFTNTSTFINFDTTYPTNTKTTCIPLFVYGVKGVL